MDPILELVFSFAIVLSGTELFTNVAGQEDSPGEGAVGSLLAAVATALPETLIPIVAVIEGGRDRRMSRSAPSSAHRSCSRPLQWSWSEARSSSPATGDLKAIDWPFTSRRSSAT